MVLSLSDEVEAAASLGDQDEPDRPMSVVSRAQKQSQRLSQLQEEVGMTVQTIVGGTGVKHGHNKDQLAYNPEWHCVRIGIACLCDSLPYKLIMAMSILFNMVILIIETDLRAHRRTQHWEVFHETNSFVFTPPEWIQMAGYVLLAFYVVDLTSRMYVFRGSFFSSTANKFDFVIVSTDCLVLMLEPLQDLPSVAVLRVLRMLRIVRVLRSFLAFRELYLMMQGLVSAIRSIIFATFLIAVVLVLWSIMAVEFVHMNNVELNDAGVYGDCSETFCRNAFSSVWLSSLTFLKGIIAGDSWGTLAYPLIIEKPWTSFVLLGSLLMVQLGLLNLIVAVIVDRAAAARENDEELMYTEKQETLEASYKRLQGLFSRMDEDGGGTLSLEEMQESYNSHAEFREILDLMDIRDRDLELVFKILDTNKDEEVSYSEFVEQLHEMKTFNAHTLLIYIKHYSERNYEMLAELQKQVALHDVNVEELRTAFNDIQPGFEFTAREVQEAPALGDVPPAIQASETWTTEFVSEDTISARRSSGMDPPASPSGCAVEASTPAQPAPVSTARQIALRSVVKDPKVSYVRPASFSEGVKVAKDLSSGHAKAQTKAQHWDLEKELLTHGDVLESSIRIGFENCIKAAVDSFIQAAVDHVSLAVDRSVKSSLDYNSLRWCAVSSALEEASKPANHCIKKPQSPVLLSSPHDGGLLSPRPDVQEVAYDTRHVVFSLDDDSFVDQEEAGFLNDYRSGGRGHNDHNDQQSLPRKPQVRHSARTPPAPKATSTSIISEPSNSPLLQLQLQAIAQSDCAAVAGTGAAPVPPPPPATAFFEAVSKTQANEQEEVDQPERHPHEEPGGSDFPAADEVAPSAPSCAVGHSFGHAQGSEQRGMPSSGPLCPNGNPTTRVVDTRSQQADWVAPPPDDLPPA